MGTPPPVDILNAQAPALARLERVKVRTVWSDEARDFTPWLATEENLALLAETVDLGDLELVGTEVLVGPYRADIVARMGDEKVIIENQFGMTDHDHLGKLLVYAAGQGAQTVIWIAETVHKQHRAAIDWLNLNTREGVYIWALEIELWRVGGSLPAPKFNVVCQPNDWAKPTTANPGEAQQLAFWDGFATHLAEEGSALKTSPVRPYSWMNVRLGRSGFVVALTMSRLYKRLSCELYIDLDKEPSKRAFALLKEDRADIEDALGATLDWRELPEKNACRIIEERPADVSNPDAWPEFFAWLRKRAEAFTKTFGPRVAALDLSQVAEGDDDSAGGVDATQQEPSSSY